MSAQPRRRTIDLGRGDGEMSALDFGDPARPIDIVFFHANGFNAQTYVSILGPLSSQLRILAVDQRGHGSTTLKADPVARRSWSDLRDDAMALLDLLSREPGFKPVVVAGHSMGATVSLLATQKQPGPVRGVVMFDPVIMDRVTTLVASLPWVSEKRWAKSPIAQGAVRRRAVFDDRQAAIKAYTGRGAFKTWPAETLADYVAGGFVDRADGKVELACAPAWEASNYASMANDPWTAAARVARPVTIFRAEKGSTCRVGDRDAFARRNRAGHLSLTLVAGTSHFLPMERPDLVREALASAVAI